MFILGIQIYPPYYFYIKIIFDKVIQSLVEDILIDARIALSALVYNKDNL